MDVVLFLGISSEYVVSRTLLYQNTMLVRSSFQPKSVRGVGSGNSNEMTILKGISVFFAKFRICE